MPCEGGEAVRPANEVCLNNNAAWVSTPHLKFLRVFVRAQESLRKTERSKWLMLASLMLNGAASAAKLYSPLP